MSEHAAPGIDYEAEYNNRARVPDHMTHIEGWQRDAAAYRETAGGELDLAYGPEERHRLDLFHPPGGDRGGPVVLFIHGGYWQALDKSSASHLARGANLRGLAVATRFSSTVRVGKICRPSGTRPMPVLAIR